MLAAHGVDLVAPHRRGRKKKRTQDARKLKRYWKRYKVERFHAWLDNFRRLVVRYERKAANYLALTCLATAKITLRKILKMYKII